MSNRLQRWLGIAGVVFVVLVAASIFTVPSTPSTHASLSKIAAFYDKSHQGALFAGAILAVAAVIVGVFWFWYFRDWLVAAQPTNRRLATVGFGGALLFAAGGSLAAGINFTLSDASGHATATVLQGLNYIQSDLNSGLIGAGTAIFLAASSAVVIRSRVLPVWLGWLAAVFAVAAVVIGFLGLIGLGLWLIATNIVIIARSRRLAVAAPPN